MSDVAIRVEGLGKMYRIGGPQARYRTLRDSLTDAVSAPFMRARSLLRGQAYGAAGLHEKIWALKDMSFEVQHGEVVGIIGRNGAGKSTLLKILSRITEPTEGVVDIFGRVGALLEVGTGFHPELTGRENVYLNGAILGMSRRDIDHKFDEIVDFAGVEKFIDTPVKHYSSGMGLRLGFAVAAHLEPEILVVDEVLAVGDSEFQKKCMGKMSDVASQGRTVLFVSHNMSAVNALCSRALLLEAGYIVLDDLTDIVLSHYQRTPRIFAFPDLAERSNNSFPIQIVHVELQDSNGNPVSEVFSGQEINIAIDFRVFNDELISNVDFAIFVRTALGENVFVCHAKVVDNVFVTLPPAGSVVCRIFKLPLIPGLYTLSLWCQNNYNAVELENVSEIMVVPGNFYRTGKLPAAKHGGVLVDYQWDLKTDTALEVGLST